MNSQFHTAYATNSFFYVFMGIATIIMGSTLNKFPPIMMIIFIAYFVGTTVAFAVAARKTKKYTLYGKLQMAAFVILNVFVSISFNSAQAFIYAMCFSTILGFVFIDAKVSKFQFVQSLIIVVVAASFIGYYTRSQQTMIAYTFGTVMLLVMNWVIVSMVSHIRFQYRKNSEQERSLDDMLKVVEAKCDEAQNATKIKSRFLAHMSHEIRTPINAVIGMNEMILRESKDNEILKYASETKNAADSLLGIINDILDITRIEAGKVTPSYAEYKPAKLINNIYNMIRFKAADKGLKFIVIADERIPVKLKGDDIHLKQIITNLLSNAIKYTHKGSVTLKIRYLGEGELFFSVEDTGIGIKEEDREKLFEAFARMDETVNRSIQGTGLGLNITSSLLKMFGSELRVTSEYGKGSVFSFVISQEIIDETPMGALDLDSSEYEQKVYKADFTASNALVLVVDDNEMNRKVFRNLLKKTQVRIEEAADGAECVEMVKQKRYDIIFMDHMMPVMDGIQALKHVRGDDESLCKDVPVIALTANAVVGAKERYFNEGFDNFLSKPVDPKKLEKMLMNSLDPALVESYADETEDFPAEEAETIELPIINGIDWRYARLNFENDGSMLDTIKMFRGSVAKDTDEINGYFSTIDNEDSVNSYRIKVHGMKSTAALIGIVRLAGMAMELEEAAREKNVAVIMQLHPVFIESWKSYYNELGVLFDDDTPLKDADEFCDEILEIFDSIRNAAKMMDVDTLDEMSKKLDEYSFDEAHTELIEQVKSSIFNFEVEKLRECSYN